MRGGIYSLHDCKVLSATVKNLKPQVVLDLGPREGRTTSVIIEALLKNNIQGGKYYLFEKDVPFLESMKEFCKAIPPKKIEFIFSENIVDFNFENIEPLDLCFIDGNHDYILARWYVDTVFPLVAKKGVIHVHDVYYGKTGKGWDDVGLQANGCTHPDILSHEVHKKLYPSIYEKYAIPGTVSIYEEDIIKDYCIQNKDSLSIYSTHYPPSPSSPSDRVPNCSLYIYNNEYFSFGV